MFTGLVQKRAKILSVSDSDFGVRLVISCSQWSKQVEIGESICVAGCCLSVVENTPKNGKNIISFDVIPETLACTYFGAIPSDSECNVERSLRADSFLGGHFVQGHVDGCEKIIHVSKSNSDDVRLRVSMDAIDKDTIVSKGSVTIDGVSLTIASVSASHFEVALIPITLEESTLGMLVEGDSVHVETDMLTKTIVNVTKNMQQKC